jgi:DNA-binding CsgD family transcriptional regulator
MNQSDVVVTTMSPAAFAPFEGFPGCCAAALDASMRILWCNDHFASLHKTSTDDLVGQQFSSLYPTDLARERETLMAPALDHDRPVTFLQMLKGVCWFTRAWPLDPEALGVRGVFVVLNQANGRRDATANGVGQAAAARCSELGDLQVLTPRELEVFYFLAAGMTVAEIGELMHRSPKTVERHLESLHRKMNFKNRAELVRSAVERGLTQFTPEEWAIFVSRKRNAI